MKFKKYLEQRLQIIKSVHKLNINGLFNTFVYLCEWKYVLLIGQRFSKSKISIINNKLDINFIDTELNPVMVICISFLLEKFCRSPLNKDKLHSPRGYTGITHLCYCTYPFITHDIDDRSGLDLIKLAKNYNVH